MFVPRLTILVAAWVAIANAETGKVTAGDQDSGTTSGGGTTSGDTSGPSCSVEGQVKMATAYATCLSMKGGRRLTTATGAPTNDGQTTATGAPTNDVKSDCEYTNPEVCCIDKGEPLPSCTTDGSGSSGSTSGGSTMGGDLTYGDYKTCEEGEVKCYDMTTYEESCVKGDSWSDCPCTPSEMVMCPCKKGEKDCMQYAYDSDGWMIDMDEGINKTHCVTSASDCKCGAGALPTACLEGEGDWAYYSCSSKTMYDECPAAACSAEQKSCPAYQYNNQTGDIDYNKPQVVSCVKAGTSCPCNAQYEEKCTDTWGSWCQEKKWGSCPMDCGTKELCYMFEYDADGERVQDIMGMFKEKQECAADEKGCKCHATYELQCTQGSKDYSWTECLSKKEYPDGCPKNCAADGQATCYPFDYAEDEENKNWAMIGTSSIVCKATYDDCWKLCGKNSELCGSGDMTYCMYQSPADATAKKSGCPIECKDTETECWADKFDDNGNWLDSTKSCVKEGTTCPCADGTQPCTDEWGQYCIPKADKCPVTCADKTPKTCYQDFFLDSGEWDSTKESVVTCVAKTATCPCGDKAVTCTWYDEYTDTKQDYCMPKVTDGIKNLCPIDCKGKESCFVEHYSTKGVMEKYEETCLEAGQKCACGNNAQQCKDEWGSYCLPTKDLAEKPQGCPKECTGDTPQQDYVPNYDSNAKFLSMKPICVAAGTGITVASCAEGTNAKGCKLEGGWIECVPAKEGCPVDCAEGEVQCPEKASYTKEGKFISFKAPAKADQCKTSLAKCGCGSGAKMCTDPAGNTECLPNKPGCPVYCKKDVEKKCTIANYNAEGNQTSSRDQCVGVNKTCECGKNTVKCHLDGQMVCVSTAMKAKVCGTCKASQETCYVVDYDKKGLPANKPGQDKIQCVNKGAACPCGKNTKSCENVQDATKKVCIPKFGRDNSCPKPCTPSKEVLGSTTCAQTNLDSAGSPTGESVSCVPGTTEAPGKCKPGKGQKSCRGGTITSVATKCKDEYGLTAKKETTTASGTTGTTSTTGTTGTTSTTGTTGTTSTTGTTGGGRRLVAAVSAVASGTQQTASVRFTLGKLKAGATGKDVQTVKSKIDSLLMLLPAIQTSFSMVVNGGEAGVTYKIMNLGRCAVTPSQIADKLRSKLNSGESNMKTALEALGTVQISGTDCCVLSTDTKIIVDKASDEDKKSAGLIIKAGTTGTTGKANAAMVSAAVAPRGAWLSLLLVVLASTLLEAKGN